MAVIKLNRTKTGVVPTALEDGELYIDQLNAKLYWADATGGIKFKSLLSEQFPSGTRMFFQQTAAPVGWTKVIDPGLDDAALRVVGGPVTTGGSTGFSLAFYGAGVNVGSTALTAAQMPSHTHTATVNDPGHVHALVSQSGSSGGAGVFAQSAIYQGNKNTEVGYTGISVSNSSTGSGQGHTHTNPAGNLKYADAIVATKD